MSEPRGKRSRSGFTLLELLVVVVIVVLLTAATLPVVLPAYQQRKVTAAALIVQAELARTRDAAIRANDIRGIRLIPETDPASQFYAFGPTPAFTRIVAIEPGPDYTEGFLQPGLPAPALGLPPTVFGGPWNLWLSVQESKIDPTTLAPNPPTSWFWNVRQGDKIRFNNTGRAYTIVGPMLITPYTNPSNPSTDPRVAAADQTQSNPERFINWGSPTSFISNPSTPAIEFLFLLNGQDDDGDGYVDEAFDGIDNDGDGVIDPGYNGLDDNGDGVVDDPAELLFNNGGEYEKEKAVDLKAGQQPYTIYRRPVPSEGSREVSLPSGIVIDMSSWSFTAERSRLPFDPFTGFVDVMIAPAGHVVSAGATTTSSAPPVAAPYYHFWLADVDDVFAPVNQSGAGVPYFLPMPQGSLFYPNPNDTTGRFLKKDRRLVSINTRTGAISTNTIDDFDAQNSLTLDRPFLAAQGGVKEVP
jgi:prepilin-type N-terminal cleavage/methylation domain-containing protein